MSFEENSGFGSTSARGSTVLGAVFGLLLGLAAIFLAIASAGAGHGDYAAARLLFPVPMLLTLVQGDSIGPLSILVVLLQYPFYGGLLGWCRAREAALPMVAVGLLHLIAAVLCFSGVLPNFS